MVFEQAPKSLTSEDIEALVDSQVPESRHLDYKQTLPEGNDNAKRDFLADISAFANSGGGVILYGISEAIVEGRKTGCPGKVVGCPNISVDEEILRLENIARGSIAPRIQLEIAHVAGTSPPVIALRVRRSWNAPHMVTFKKSSRFYARNSAGKYRLDVGEIRTAFLASEELPRRLRDFRVDRLARIGAGDCPVPMDESAKLVLHVVPAGAMGAGEQLAPERAAEQRGNLQPMGASGYGGRYNFDGYLVHGGLHEGKSNSYVQVFRSGVFEAVLGRLLSEEKDGTMLASLYYEKMVIQMTSGISKSIRALDLPGPYFVMLTLLGVKGARMAVERRRVRDEWHPFDRNILVIPEVVLESMDVHPAEVLRPAFDAVWQSAGFERSYNYDEHGSWAPSR
ncbi:MAG: ATP-binding protein [Gammaproteobacteria bacterium]|nr:ATP-binding protein [Gammaproteobacteria bacterium]